MFDIPHYIPFVISRTKYSKGRVNASTARGHAQGSRVLLFSQYTLTLDVLCEYCAERFGPEGQGYLRLDGATNRIKREMDARRPPPRFQTPRDSESGGPN
jgi:SNF2 family DNA or RNA helicase